MRKLGIRQVLKLMSDADQLPVGRVPRPFPGGSSPTRVAWRIRADFGKYGKSVYNDERRAYEVSIVKHEYKVHEYVGKPCRYRAQEATRFLQRAKRAKIVDFFQAEFDADGLVAYYVHDGLLRYTDAYFAYHPQGGTVNPMDAFTKPIFIKRIGKFPTYSHQKKLSQEQIDQFYKWWGEHFDKKAAPLKRPRKKAAKGSSEAVLEAIPLIVEAPPAAPEVVYMDLEVAPPMNGDQGPLRGLYDVWAEAANPGPAPRWGLGEPAPAVQQAPDERGLYPVYPPGTRLDSITRGNRGVGVVNGDLYYFDIRTHRGTAFGIDQR